MFTIMACECTPGTLLIFAVHPIIADTTLEMAWTLQTGTAVLSAGFAAGHRGRTDSITSILAEVGSVPTRRHHFRPRTRKGRLDKSVICSIDIHNGNEFIVEKRRFEYTEFTLSGFQVRKVLTTDVATTRQYDSFFLAQALYQDIIHERENVVGIGSRRVQTGGQKLAGRSIRSVDVTTAKWQTQSISLVFQGRNTGQNNQVRHRYARVQFQDGLEFLHGFRCPSIARPALFRLEANASTLQEF
jgi:hypothetical protein